MVKRIKEHMGPTDFVENFRFFKKSKNGDLLIQFANSQGPEDDVQRVRDKLSNINPEVIGKVFTLGRPDKIDIIDIDPSSSKEEVLEVLRASAPPSLRDKIQVTGMWETSSGFARASATVPRGFSTGVRNIRVGFFKCRLRPSIPPPPRCFKCQGYGHIARQCKGPDLSGTCLRCTSKGHSTAHCTEDPARCIACDRLGLPPKPHKPGSVQCGARQRASRPTTATSA